MRSISGGFEKLDYKVRYAPKKYCEKIKKKYDRS